jgi:hypothetical protein
VQLSGQDGCTNVQKRIGQVCGKPVLPECTDVQQADLGGSAAVQPFTDQSRVIGEAHLQQQQQLQPGVEAMCSAKGQLFRDARSSFHSISTRGRFLGQRAKGYFQYHTFKETEF